MVTNFGKKCFSAGWVQPPLSFLLADADFLLVPHGDGIVTVVKSIYRTATEQKAS
jgi:putative effector of murein hydrolase LrgA (UPF0299 family)